MISALRPRSRGDLVAGGIFIAFGIAFAIGAAAYDLGTLLRMGPGYFPLLCAVVLVALGVLIVVKAYVSPDTNAEENSPIQLRPILFLSGALTFFTFTIDGLGILIATFGTAVLAALARKGTPAIRVLLIASSLTAACYLIFVVGLGQRLPVVGDWIAG